MSTHHQVNPITRRILVRQPVCPAAVDSLTRSHSDAWTPRTTPPSATLAH